MLAILLAWPLRMPAWLATINPGRVTFWQSSDNLLLREWYLSEPGYTPVQSYSFHSEQVVIIHTHDEMAGRQRTIT
jgi:hypothetical protein